MKIIASISFLLLFSFEVTAQYSKHNINTPDSTQKILLVDAACGMCQFGMKAQDCKLAVRIDGKAYEVEGTSIDEHGDAHATDGFCNTIRKAAIQGHLQDNKFAVTYFKLVQNTKKSGNNKNPN